MTKPDKYLPENQTWYKVDNFRNCKKIPLKCKYCNHLGHYSEHLNQHKQMMMINENTGEQELHLRFDLYVHHSHWIADLDRGRHVRCKFDEEWRPVSDPSIKTMYRSSKSRDPPQWVKDELGYDE